MEIRPAMTSISQEPHQGREQEEGQNGDAHVTTVKTHGRGPGSCCQPTESLSQNLMNCLTLIYKI